VLSVGFTSALLCWAVGKRLRLLAEVREVYTVPDAVAARYGGRAAGGLAALAVLVGTVAYLGAQLRALGVLIEAIFGTSRPLGGAGEGGLGWAVAVGVALVLAYAVAGGMVAGVYTDLIQGVLMMAAGVAVFYWAIRAGGGLSAIAADVSASPDFGPRFLDPLGTVPPATAFGFLLGFSVGVLGQPQMLHKFYMLKDPAKLRWLPLVIGVSQSLCVLIWLGVGLVVPALVARGAMAPLGPEAGADRAATEFLLGFAAEIVAGLAFTGVLAALMSTAASFVNLGSAALGRDLPRAFGRPLADELAWGRVAVVGVAVASAAVAWAYGDLIALLGTFAFGTFAAALAPALAVGLNWKRVTRRAAIASMVTGMVLNVGLELLGDRLLPPGVLPSAVALAASFTVLFAVTWIDSRGGRGGRGGRLEELAPDVAAVMEM
jgi:Na+/proline symporter